MKQPHQSILALMLLAGLNLMAGCGLTSKTNPSSNSTAQTGLQQPAPLERLSPKLAADACLATARELEQKGRHRDAIVQYERARSHQPKRTGIAHRLAVLHDRLGDTQTAWAEYQKALEDTPQNSDLLNDLGYFHFQRKQFPEAEQAYRRAVELDPDNTRAWTNLGLTLGALKRFDEAEGAFQKAGSPAFAKHNLGIVLAQSGEYDKARQAFYEAKQLDPLLKQPAAVLNWMNETPLPTGSAQVTTPQPTP